MSDNLMQKYLSLCIVGLFILSAFGAMGTVLSGEDNIPDIDSINSMEDGDELLNDSDIDMLDESLREAVNGNIKGLTKVIIATTNLGELADFLDDYEYRGLLGNKGIPDGTIKTVELEVPINSLDAIAELPSVYGIYSYPEIDNEMRHPEEINQGSDSEGATPLSLYDSEMHKAQDAWSAGYIGTGSNVAIPEGGIDFGHPDLQGTQARVPATLKVIGETLINGAANNETEAFTSQTGAIPGTYTIYINGIALVEGTDYAYDIDTGFVNLTAPMADGEILTADYQFNSPYAGWPIVFDYNSMSTYLDTGDTTDTWYVSTNETATKYSTASSPELNIEVSIDKEN